MKNKLYKILCVVFAVLFVASAALSVFLYKDLQNERNRKADINLYNWSRVHEMAQTIQRVNDTEHARDIYYLQNGTFFTLDGNSLYPNFDNLDAGTNNEYFLTIHLNDFIHMITLAKEVDSDLKERFELLHEIGEKMEKISLKVLEYGEKGKTEKLELLDKNSDIYKEIEFEIKEFCNTYISRIKKYN